MAQSPAEASTSTGQPMPLVDALLTDIEKEEKVLNQAAGKAVSIFSDIIDLKSTASTLNFGEIQTTGLNFVCFLQGLTPKNFQDALKGLIGFCDYSLVSPNLDLESFAIQNDAKVDLLWNWRWPILRKRVHIIQSYAFSRV